MTKNTCLIGGALFVGVRVEAVVDAPLPPVSKPPPLPLFDDGAGVVTVIVRGPPPPEESDPPPAP
jgi:hypothetical protein